MGGGGGGGGGVEAGTVKAGTVLCKLRRKTRWNGRDGEGEERKRGE